jgi:hypothetical protein
MDAVAMPQQLYEQIRPILLFGETAGERAKEINAAQRALSRNEIRKLQENPLLGKWRMHKARGPCVFQRTHLAGDAAGPQNVVDSLQ